MTTLRVLLVVPSMTPEAGAETSLASVIPHLVAAGMDVHLAILTANQSLVPSLRVPGVTIHDLSGHRRVGEVSTLRRLIKRTAPSVVHATLFRAAVPAQLATLGVGIPVLVTWANTPTENEAVRVASWKLGLVRQFEAGLGAISRSYYHAVTQGVADTKGRELRVPHGRIRVAERGRDPERFTTVDPSRVDAVRSELGLGGRDQLLLAIGRQEHQKGYDQLLWAFERAAETDPFAHLALAGRKGSATAQIDSILATLRHAARVHVLGHRDDIPELLCAADFVVCASRREGATGALIEAMASHTPIVSVEIAGLRGVLVDDVNAIVVPRDQLAEGLQRALSDPVRARELADRAQATFFERFTIERSAASLFDVYRWVADRT